ncbi:hypothetical protein [Candidatus Albibeggiatoa sp. nov. NOAA]|uniref:hypothetical protein n=1 Tax=Candidatus Albibeggiatoa sp. nov. NOAA TaxID=3162724 RepID=UPI0032FA8B62|nr:hypothetical protein [Thiotrichaceae bacterium]
MELQNIGLIGLIALIIAVATYHQQIRDFFSSHSFRRWLILNLLYMNQSFICKDADLAEEVRRTLFKKKPDDESRQHQLRTARVASEFASSLKHTIQQIDKHVLRVVVYRFHNGDHSNGLSLQKVSVIAENTVFADGQQIPFMSDILQTIEIERLPYRFEDLTPNESQFISLVDFKSSEIRYEENPMRQKLMSYQVKSLISQLVMDVHGEMLALVEVHFQSSRIPKMEAVKNSIHDWMPELENGFL